MFRRPARLLLAAVSVGLCATALTQSSAVAEDPYVPPDRLDASLEEVTEPASDAVSLLTTSTMGDAYFTNFEQAAKECVQRAGFEYQRPSTPARKAYPDGPSGESGYGLSDLMSPQPEDADKSKASARAANLKYADGLPGAKRAAYLRIIGETPSGRPSTPGEPHTCPAAAVEAIAQPAMQANDEFARQLEALSKAISRDPVMVKAYREWSACMNSFGFSYATPSAPRQQLAAELAEERAVPVDMESFRERERKIAAADSTCREQAGHAAARTEAIARQAEKMPFSRDVVLRASGAIRGQEAGK